MLLELTQPAWHMGTPGRVWEFAGQPWSDEGWVPVDTGSPHFRASRDKADVHSTLFLKSTLTAVVTQECTWHGIPPPFPASLFQDPHS